ncbi:MAG: hypothetical protein Athens071426_194, partial [Parcubacteria group bacterium Athens0714_26]
MDRFKSILKTLSFWSAFVAAVILGFGAIYRLTEKGGLGSITSWVLAGVALSLLVSLFIARRQIFKIPIIILAALWLIYLISLVSRANILESGVNALSLFAAVFYLGGAYLITKQRLLKIIGVLLILAAVFVGVRNATIPNYSLLTISLSLMILALTIGIAIFMIMRKGIGLRLLGVGLVFAIMGMVSASFVMNTYSTIAIIGKDRTIILASVEPRINDFIEAWNDKDYQKLSKDFSDEMKGKFSQDKFLSARNESGKLISTDELRKVAPKNNSPLVIIEALVINVMYGATFEKDPINILAFTVQFRKYDSKYLIRGLTFGPLDLTNTKTSPTTTYTISFSDPKTKTIERYKCSSPKYNDNQAKALAPSDSFPQKLNNAATQLNSMAAQLNSMAAQLNEMGSQNSTNNYNALTDDYDALADDYSAQE